MFNVFVVSIVSAIGFCIGCKIYRKLNKLFRKTEKVFEGRLKEMEAQNALHD